VLKRQHNPAGLDPDELVGDLCGIGLPDIHDDERPVQVSVIPVATVDERRVPREMAGM